MKFLALFMAIMAVVFAVVGGMSIIPNAGIKEHRESAGCGGGGRPPPPPPPSTTAATNSTG